jgi:hypothetical protein
MIRKVNSPGIKMFEVFNSRDKLFNLVHGTLLIHGLEVGKITNIFKNSKKLAVDYLDFSFDERSGEIDTQKILKSKNPLFYKLYKSRSFADIVVTSEAFKFVSKNNPSKSAIKITQLNVKENKGNYEKCVFSWLKYQELPPILASVAADYSALSGIEVELKTLRSIKGKFNTNFLSNQMQLLTEYLAKEKWGKSLDLLRALRRNKACSLLDIHNLEDSVVAILLNYGYATQGNQDFYRLCNFIIDDEIKDNTSFRLLTQELE